MQALAFAGLSLFTGGVVMCRNKTKDDSAAQFGKAPDSMNPIKVAYWNMCGLGQPLRLLLAYSDMPFQDVRYTCHAKEDGSWDRTEWTDVKFKLGLALPNLPYMIDGDKSLTETNAILLYLGEKAGLCGKTAFDRAEVAMLLSVVMDLRNSITRTAYGSKDGYPARLEELKAAFRRHFAKLSGALGDQSFLASFGLCPADFHFYELLRQATLMAPGCLDEYASLQAYMARFEDIPAIKAYQASEHYTERPCNNPMACFV